MNLLSTDDTLSHHAPPRDGAAKVVFPSAYRLTGNQEKDLIEHAMKRLSEVSKELGRNVCGQIDWYASASTDQVNAGAKSFLGRRQIYEMVYEQEMEWRAHLRGGIYEESNWTVPISRRVVSHQIARASAHFTGTDPWFSADIADPAIDPDTKQRAERWMRSKFREARIKAAIDSAIERAFVRGEAVLKRAHRQVSDIFKAEMLVLIDTKTNKPVLDSRGEYITPERQTQVIQVEVPAGPIGRAFSQPAKSVEKLALADDPSIVLPEGRKFEKRIVPRRTTIYNGPHLELCYFKDILIPLTAKDVDTAECVFHLYDLPVSELADTWKRRGEGLGEEAQNMDTTNAVAAIIAMRGNTQSGFEADREDTRGSTSLYRDERPEDRSARDERISSMDGRATAKVAECWLRYDADGDGILENILLVIDTESSTPIYYDYVGNITPDGKRPFSVIRVNPVDGRWYGVGSMQVYEAIQGICDLQVNRWNRSQGESGRITGVDRTKIVGGETDPDLDLNWGDTIKLIEGAKMEDAVSYVTLPEVKGEDLKNLMDFYLQMAFNMSGVQTANDAQMAGLASAKNATSILNIDKAGHEMFGQQLSHLEEGIEPTLDALAEITVVNMASQETYEWTEADRTSFGVFTRALLGERRMRLRLLLTKYKAEQEKVAIGASIDRAVAFYTLPPQAQQQLAPLFQQFLRVNDIAGAKELIQPMAAPLLPPGTASGGETGTMQGATTYPNGDPGAAPSIDTYAAQIPGGIAGGMAGA